VTPYIDKAMSYLEKYDIKENEEDE